MSAVEWYKVERYEHRDPETGAWLTVRGSADEWTWTINNLGEGNAVGLTTTANDGKEAALEALATYAARVAP